MVRLNAELPDIAKREIELRTASILRHDELMSRLGFAITGLAVSLIYIARLYRKQRRNVVSSQSDSNSYQSSPTPAIWRPNPRRREKETPQPIKSNQEHNNAELKYRGSQQPEKAQDTASFKKEVIDSAYLRSDLYQPRDYGYAFRQFEAEAEEHYEAKARRHDAEIRARRAAAACRASESYVMEWMRPPAEQDTTMAVLSGLLEPERRFKKLDIGEVNDSDYWDAVLG